MQEFDQARALLRKFKGDSYGNGFDVLPQLGPAAAAYGRRAVLVRDDFPANLEAAKIVTDSLDAAGVEVAETIEGARPNAPREDLERIAACVIAAKSDVVISLGGGSTIDAAKSAIVLDVLGGAIDDYFGMNLVTAKLAETGRALTPHIAIQTAASSGAHLTKYSNITDLATGQKKLIVDNAIVPQRAFFDYGVTFGAPPALTADGALDGTAHILEVLWSAVGKPYYCDMEQVANTGLRLIFQYLPRVIENPRDREGREALGLGTDLGGYAIMLGGTNGAHLTSFSLIDILSHGRACAIMNPYYIVFFAPAIQEPLKLVAGVCAGMGYADRSIENLTGRALGIAVAEAYMAFERKVGVPPRLCEVPGFTDAHIARALTAAKNPQLRMKLENMPVPLTAEMVDDYMGPVLEAAKTGVLDGIRNVA